MYSWMMELSMLLIFSLLVDYIFSIRFRAMELVFVNLSFIHCLTSSASREGFDCGAKLLGLGFWGSIRREIANKTLGHWTLI